MLKSKIIPGIKVSITKRIYNKAKVCMLITNNGILKFMRKMMKKMIVAMKTYVKMKKFP